MLYNSVLSCYSAVILLLYHILYIYNYCGIRGNIHSIFMCFYQTYFYLPTFIFPNISNTSAVNAASLKLLIPSDDELSLSMCVDDMKHRDPKARNLTHSLHILYMTTYKVQVTDSPLKCWALNIPHDKQKTNLSSAL